jgi:MoaA/NifB/PqqE/SkfB family radical SAM enzyme
VSRLDVVTRANLRLLARHPRVIGRLARNYLRLAGGERRLLRGVEFCVTYRCQLNCPHCLTKALVDDRRAELTADEAVRAIRDLARLGAIFINVTGGEPLVREDLFDILREAARDRGLLITLASNGLSLDEAVARELARVGVPIVTMSLDGPDAATHDARRAQAGAFTAVLRAAEAVKAAGLDLWFTTILTREDAVSGAAFAIADLAERLGATLTVNFAYAVGNWRDRAARISTDEERVFRELLKRRHVRWEGSTNYLREGCPAGTEKLYVTPYGDLMPCATIQRSFGNLREEPLAAIWQRMGRAPWFDGRCKPCLVAEDDEFIAREMPTIQAHPGKRWDDR